MLIIYAFFSLFIYYILQYNNIPNFGNFFIPFNHWAIFLQCFFHFISSIVIFLNYYCLDSYLIHIGQFISRILLIFPENAFNTKFYLLQLRISKKKRRKERRSYIFSWWVTPIRWNEVSSGIQARGIRAELVRLYVPTAVAILTRIIERRCTK